MERSKIIGLIVAAAMIIAAITYFESTKAAPKTGGGTETIDLRQEYPEAPELQGLVGYINTDENISIQNGKVVLIDFWTYSCINCIRTLPYLTSWDEKYRDEGLLIIGVHTPEFEFEKDIDNVRAAMEKYGIKYPVVLDNNYATWRAYKNRYWPRKYLLDNEGKVRYDHIGEGAYEETETKIQELLSEAGSKVDNELTQEEEKARRKTTPELYAGYKFALPRGQDVGNEIGLQPEKLMSYEKPEELPWDQITLAGDWKVLEDKLEAASNASIHLVFLAGEVNIVADSIEPTTMEVYINNEKTREITIDKPQLYNAYNSEYGRYELRLDVKPGFSFNSFTFG